MMKNGKKMKKIRENCNFSFFGKLQFSLVFLHFFPLFFHFFHFFIFFFFHHFSSIPPLEAKMIKKMIKNDKKMKKLEENCNFPFFVFFFAPLEEKMIKND